jgi:hypothetical protein
LLKAGIDHGGELAGEDSHGFGLHPHAEDVDFFLAQAGLDFVDAYDEVAHLAQLSGKNVSVLSLQRARYLATGTVSHGVVILDGQFTTSPTSPGRRHCPVLTMTFMMLAPILN